MLDFLSDWLPRLCTSGKAEGLDENHEEATQGKQKHEQPQRRRGMERSRQSKTGITVQEVRL